MKKRILSFLLTAIMILTMMPVTAYAEPELPSFKAVYDTTDGANVLTFYYDNIDHKGTNPKIMEWDNLPTDLTTKSWPYDAYNGFLKEIVFDESIKDFHGLTSTAYMFYACINVKSITGEEYLDVSNVTNMTGMFSSFGSSITDLNFVPDVSEWNTSKVTSFFGMFCAYGGGSSVLTEVPDVSEWITSSATDFSTIFSSYGATSTVLNKVPDVSKWDTSNVTSFDRIFSDYGKSSTVLNKTPDLSNWNTANVTSVNSFFDSYADSSTEIEFSLDLSGWDLSKVLEYKVGAALTTAAKNGKSWTVSIPLYTGTKTNNPSQWFTGPNGVNNNSIIKPLSGKYFKLPLAINNGAPEAAATENNGYITINRTGALEGSTVTITAVPNDGYQLKKEPYYILDSVTYSATRVGETNNYTITMPNKSITIKAEFVATPQVGDKFEVDGITYKITALGTTNTVEVSPNSYLLDKVTIPEKVSKDSIEFTVTSIGDGAFKDDTKLLEITLPDSITNIGKNAFDECCLLPSITIPSGVTNIGEYAFDRCFALEGITLPDNLASIGDYAFNSCVSFAQITIPANVDSIGCCAFDNTEISTVILSGAVPPTLKSNVFTYKVTSIIVPKSALAAYKEAASWSNYTDRLNAYFSVDASSLTNGTVTIDENVLSGETATLKVVPAENYQLKADSLKVIYNTDKSIVPEATQTEGEYTFVMPEYDVEITAEFEEKPSEIKFTVSSDKDTYLEGELITLTATVMDGNTPVDKEFVVFSVNGRTIKVQTINGSCSISTSLPAGTYTISACYEKDGDNYKDEVEVTVMKQPNENYIVKFDLNNGNTNGPEMQTIEEGKKATKPENPTYEGFVFAGWYTDKDCTDGNEYDFDSEVKEDFVLYAKWISNLPETHLVVFDTNGHDEIDAQEIKHGEKATKPADPSDEGWIFEGWYSDAELTKEYDFSAPIMADIKLFAKWTEEGLPTPPEPKPVEVYYAPLVADLKANEDGIIEWEAGDSLPLEAVKLLVEKPELSLEFTFTYEGEEHTIFIPAGAFEKYYDVTIPWYGPAWLIQYFEKSEKEVIEYTIVSGDTLNALAEKFKCTVEEILALNPYISDKHWIYPNNKLLIPVQK